MYDRLKAPALLAMLGTLSIPAGAANAGPVLEAPAGVPALIKIDDERDNRDVWRQVDDHDRDDDDDDRFGRDDDSDDDDDDGQGSRDDDDDDRDD